MWGLKTILIVSMLCCVALAVPQPMRFQDEEFRKAALQEVLEDLMTKNEGDSDSRVNLASISDSEEGLAGDLINDKKTDDQPKYDRRLSTDLLANVMESLNAEEQAKVPNGVGVTYTRLGNDKCAGNSELVYYGVVAGSHAGHRGGGSNYLCLPHEPEYPAMRRGGFQGYSILYGTEYEAPLRAAVHDHNIPCAVCFTPKRSSTVMIPALTKCPKPYTTEYEGYLMSENKGHFRTEFVCVDKEMDVARGTHQNTNGALMYHVEVDCNTGIDCFPYRHDRELACVVCSR